MKKNIWILRCLLIFNVMIFFNLIAADNRQNVGDISKDGSKWDDAYIARSGGGGRSGGGSRGKSVGSARSGNKGGTSIQRSPSMSRSSVGTKQNVSRPSSNVSKQQGDRNISRPTSPKTQIAGQRDTKNQVQQFIKNTPSQVSRERSSSIDKNLGQNVKYSNNIGKNVQNNVNKNYPNRNRWFNRDFFDNHYYQPPYYNNNSNLWGTTTAIGLGSWLGWQAEPYYYGYDNGYYGPMEYNDVYSEINYQIEPSQDIVVNDVADSNWMPLGVFSISKGGEDEITPTMFLQLALNKDGTISGTFYNTIINEVYEIVGEVESTSQRAIWKIADNENSPIIETGIYNLTQDVVPILIHFSNGLTQNRVLIRVNKV